MDDFEKLIEKYRRELIEFSKNCPQDAPCSEGRQCETDCRKEHEEAEVSPGIPESRTVPVSSAPEFESYDDFLKANPQSGTMRVQVYAAGQAFPVSNAKITITLELNAGEVKIFEGLTDTSGIIDGIILPAPSAELSQFPPDTPVLPYSSYRMKVEHPEFADAEFSDIPVFSGIRSIQGVELIPLVSDGSEPLSAETDESDSFSGLKGAEYPWQLP